MQGMSQKAQTDLEDVQIPATTSRPPVVTVMGHVDHGKTSILDKIRNTAVQEKEHGGITQSIGAYQVEHNGDKITFIDTPGHAAFSQMRARGGKVADIVVLVVAADDGVQPQTIEAIHHAQASESRIIVALNKIDLEAANPTLSKKQLHDSKVNLAEYGGDIELIETSAETGQGLDKLLDLIIKTSRVPDLDQNLAVDPNTSPKGVIIESYLDAKRGPIASLLILDGTLHMRDVIVAGKTHARIKLMHDWQGNRVDVVGPSTPVEVLGFSQVPKVGLEFAHADDLKQAQQIVTQTNRTSDERKKLTAAERVQKAFLSGKTREIPVVIKADSQGSLEAVIEAIKPLQTDDVKIKILHHGIGEISETDVFLAMPVSGIILGFNVDISSSSKQIARREKLIHRSYNIIYHLLEELEQVIQGEIAAMAKKITGTAQVKQIFELTNGSIVAGSAVIEGILKAGQTVEIVRDDEVLTESKIATLKHGRENVNSAKAGTECGILLKPEVEIQVGDVIQAVEQN